MINNFLVLSIAAVVAIGTYFPVPAELITGERVTIAAPFYNKATGPLWAALILLMGVAPLTMWTRTSIRHMRRYTLGPLIVATLITLVLFVTGTRVWVALLGYWIVTFSMTLTLLEFVRAAYARMRSKGENPFKALSVLIARSRRRYGGYIIHMGVLIMAFGIIASTVYQQETQIRLSLGQTADLEEFTMEFAAVDRFPGPDDLLITEATVNVFKNGEFVRTLTPRTELYTRTMQPMTIPSARSTLTEDFYVILVNHEGTTADEATFRIYLNPLINWVWAGGLVFALGTLVAIWPDPAEQRIMAGTRARSRRYAVGVSGD
jgi:cytochrome c-type biogenesis protein CcmF